MISNPNELPLSSYSKNQWVTLLSDTAYRGFKVNEISKRCKEGYTCSLENDHLIKLISSTGQKILTVDMNEARKKQGQWTLSRLFHNFRMLFTRSAYATAFNERIHQLAKILYITSRSKAFQERCQDNLGNFALLPPEIHDQIINAMPSHIREEDIKCIEIMKRLWKAPLGDEVIYGTIDVKKFASWVNKKRVDPLTVNLKISEAKLILPYVKRLDLDNKEFVSECFEVVGTCRNLESLTISLDKYITCDPLRYISKLSNLKSLEISSSSNINESLKKITNLEKLSNLSITFCQIDLEGCSALKKFKNLTDLSINQPKLKDAKILESLSEMEKLESLSLCNTEFTGTDYIHLEKYPNLRSLEFGCKKQLDYDLVYIGRIQNLTSLRFGSCDLTRSGLKHLINLENLKNLIISECKNVTDDSFQDITQMKNLTHLQISRSAISGRGFAYLKAHENLQSIKLSSCHYMTNSIFLDIAQIKSLTYLEVWSCRGLSKRKFKKLPIEKRWW